MILHPFVCPTVHPFNIIDKSEIATKFVELQNLKNYKSIRLRVILINI